MNKEEFIEKYHTKKTYKFEPPIWEEFLKTKNNDCFAHWFCGDIGVIMCEENNEKGILRTENFFEVTIYEDYSSKGKTFRYRNSYGIDNREEIYYETLEYAKRIFLGEI